MKREAIFDMDGTLFDTAKFYVKAWTETANFFGVEYFDKVVEKVVERAEQDLELLLGAKEILEYFSGQNVLMVVASSSPRWAVEKNLRQAGIRDYFTALVGGDDILQGKPAPDIFLKSAKEVNLSPNDCYVFEDSFNGIRVAYSASCVPVMIPNQREPTEESS